MREVLIVSYFFPPADGIGGLRVSKMAKYLPEFGWSPTVLTVELPTGAPAGAPVEIPESRIVRTDCMDPLRWYRRYGGVIIPVPPGTPRSPAADKGGLGPHLERLARDLRDFVFNSRLVSLLGNEKPRWYPYGLSAGVKLLTRRRFDAILSSSSPLVVNCVASRLQKFSGLPWVAEFRDLWSHNHVMRTLWFEEYLERHILRNARHLVTVSAPLAATLASLHHKPVSVITNGFDEADYATDTDPHTQKLTITYTGSTYSQQDPSPLFEAVRWLKERGLVTPSEFEVLLYGPNLQSIAHLPARYGIEDLVSFKGWVTLRESRQAQLSASVLLSLTWTDPRSPGVYTAKIFEYLGARRPILAVGPRGGVIEALLKETQSGVASDSPREIADLLKRWLAEWRTHGYLAFAPDDAARKCHTRKEQARQMAAVLDQ